LEIIVILKCITLLLAVFVDLFEATTNIYWEKIQEGTAPENAHAVVALRFMSWHLTGGHTALVTHVVVAHVLLVAARC
jgi:hypothetical protein